MKKAKIVEKWLATNPTQHQKDIVQKYVHQTMFLFFMLGFGFFLFVFLLLGVLLA